MLLNLEKIAHTDKKRVVIIGGGFAGLELAKTLSKADLQIVLIDKNNYHTFQPLLYQVATAGLEASSIIHPYRRIMQDQENFFFRMAEAQSIDTATNTLETSIGFIRYDYLVIATGATANFYGNTVLQEKAISLKSIEDALLLRNTIISNFEKALQVNDEEQLNSLMDFVIVGGGPTGVEIAGALSELRKHVFPKGFRELDFVNMDIHLIQSGPDLLKGMSPKASKKAYEYLEGFGVKVWLNRRVKSFDGYKVTLDNGEQLCSRILIWAAGVTGAPVEGLKAESMKGNQYLVDQYNRVSGYDNIFALGDIAAMVSPEHPDGCPMLAQPAIQQGRNLGHNILRYQAGKKPKPFRYNDRGSMATIGRNKAVADLKLFNREIRTQGFRAWLIWMFIHLISIIGFRNRLVVLINWVWKYLRYDAGIGVIIGARKENTPVEESVEKARI
ncbi:NAD(P)/FAD-dependent oxidoreductase [Chitinophaga horti]|uniref:NADH:ubiquinone reductase (non-electrogenic) n=1 Tax=Chitinophaga horti TaxID=2920382 RepID=A0ABY6IUY5_9BACT|nr:NAD(P)/FAD-dependent oxidoreductase [Chitinophaga horti]UYQ91006.1 NAD(P)/FAD-dependent oxidoreductase [Chitinophaga horti]